MPRESEGMSGSSLRGRLQKVALTNGSAAGEAGFEVVRMEEKDLARGAEFLSEVLGVAGDCIATSSGYLRWKYLSPLAPRNVCLFLEHTRNICAIVGGIVWPYIIEGKALDICFPAEWYSRKGNPIKGAGRRIMHSLIEMFPASLAVGGSKICYRPQREVGFRDIGDVLLLSIDRAFAASSFRSAAKGAVGWCANPLRRLSGLRLGTLFSRATDIVFRQDGVADADLCRSNGLQLFSRGIPRDALVKRWRHYMEQPCNPSHIVAAEFKGRVSYALICEFTDSRSPAYGFVDCIIDPGHSARDMLSAFAAYACRHGGSDAMVMTNDASLIADALALGYQVRDRMRTQYFSVPGAPTFGRVADFPSISFLSLDELCYHIGSADRCGIKKGARP